MRMYDLTDPEGRIFAFEISNLWITRRGVSAVAEAIPGATVTENPRRLGWPLHEEFCEFVVDGQAFTAWEPFGDNSRYWIGPSPPRWCPQVDTVRMAFSTHTPVLGTLFRLFKRPQH
jgi:hypothetical protein